MKFIFLFIISILVSNSCGTETVDKRTRPTSTPIISEDGWVVIGKVIINTKKSEGLSLVENITYTVAVTNQFTIDTGSLSPVEGTDTLDLGSVTLSQLKVTNLNQCGVGNDEKCTSAIIRVYTTEVSGHAGITGFVNKDESYGVDVKAGEGTADTLVGLTDTNAATVDSYTIPASDKKLSISDMNGVTYEIEVDFSNAGAGDYEMNLVIEAALGL